MRHLNNDQVDHGQAWRCAAIRAMQGVRLSVFSLGLVVAIAALPATAQVTLDTSVQKVETLLTETGETERRLVDAGSVVPGDELRYSITFTNAGSESVDAGSVVITNPLPDGTEYLEDTALGSGTDIAFSVDGEHFAVPDELTVTREGIEVPVPAQDYRSIRWLFRPALEPGETGNVSFRVRLR